MTNLPAEVLAWGLKLAESKRDEAKAKQTRERVAAELDKEARDVLSGDKKPTEASIAAWVKMHPDMQSAETAVIDASFQTDHARAVVESLHTKKDMLVLLGGK